MDPRDHARAVRKERKPDLAGIGSATPACASATRRLREGKAMPIDEYLWLPCWGCTGIGRMSALGANRTRRDGGNDVTHSGHRDAFAERILWNIGRGRSLRFDVGIPD